MKKPFNLSMILILALVLLTGAATMPGPVGGSGGAKITGAASTIATANLTASRALVSNASGKVEASSVTATQLGLLGSVAANSIIARPSASPGAPSAVTLSASQFPCRGSTGDVAACGVGSGLSFSGTTLSATGGGTSPSYCRYSGVAARGSTNTYVLRWSTAQEACTGSDLSYSASATLGDSFPVATSGVYTISVGLYASGPYEALIMIGSSISNTVSPDSADMRKFHLISAYQGSMDWTGYIASGSKIFVTTGAAPYNGNPLVNSISIARIN